jgi:hypothetical protein
MRHRTRVIASAAVTAALAAGSTGAAVASATGAKPGAPAKTMSASEKPGGSKSAEERQGHDALTAAVAQELHVSTARVSVVAGILGGRPFARCQHPAAVRRARARQAEPGRRHARQAEPGRLQGRRL